jgi:hypothetical protein
MTTRGDPEKRKDPKYSKNCSTRQMQAFNQAFNAVSHGPQKRCQTKWRNKAVKITLTKGFWDEFSGRQSRCGGILDD